MCVCVCVLLAKHFIIVGNITLLTQPHHVSNTKPKIIGFTKEDKT